MTTVVISQPMLFPWVGMLEQVRHADVFVHYDDVAFSKGSFVNRVQVKTPHGSRWLTIPLRDRRFGDRITDLRTDERRPWRKEHLDRLQTSYGKAPCFDDVRDIVRRVYAPTRPLADLLIHGLQELCSYFGLGAKTDFHRSSELTIGGASTDRVLALLQHFGADKYVTGHGARRYLDHERLEQQGIEVEYMNYQRRPYPQPFGLFDPHVSSLDLIAAVGRNGASLISSPTIPWRSFLLADSG